jgi:cytochrome c biogenesis protein CcmG/thiol:disulfide interchange protein DsbE
MRILAWPLAIFGLLALLFTFALRSGDPSKLPSALIGRPAPSTPLPALEGLSDGAAPIPGLSVEELGGGQVTIVNFWASWCAPCLQEHPQLMALKEKSGARLVGISYKDQATNARRFLGRYGNPFSAVGTDGDGRAGIEWGVIAVPETFVVDGRGVVVYKHTGPISPESLENAVIPAIRAAKAPELRFDPCASLEIHDEGRGEGSAPARRVAASSRYPTTADTSDPASTPNRSWRGAPDSGSSMPMNRPHGKPMPPSTARPAS